MDVLYGLKLIKAYPKLCQFKSQKYLSLRNCQIWWPIEEAFATGVQFSTDKEDLPTGAVKASSLHGRAAAPPAALPSNHAPCQLPDLARYLPH